MVTLSLSAPVKASLSGTRRNGVLLVGISFALPWRRIWVPAGEAVGRVMAEERRDEERMGWAAREEREGRAGEPEGAGAGLDERAALEADKLGATDLSAAADPLLSPRDTILPLCASSFAWMVDEDEDDVGESAPSLSSASRSFFHLEQWVGAGRGSGEVGDGVVDGVGVGTCRPSYERRPRTSVWHSRVSPTRGYIRSASSATAGRGRVGVEGRRESLEGDVTWRGSGSPGAGAAIFEGTAPDSLMLLGLVSATLLDAFVGAASCTSMTIGERLRDVSCIGFLTCGQGKALECAGVMPCVGPGWSTARPK